MLKLRDFRNCLRYRRVVRNPWRAVKARGIGPGKLLELELRRGGKVFVRSGTSDIRIFKEIFVKDVYGLSEFEGEHASPPLDCVMDIGGHIGFFSIRVSPLARRVIVCEPVPENVQLLRRNLDDTACANVSLVHCAVTATAGNTQVFTSPNPARHSVLASLVDSGAESVSVKARTLSDLFEDHKVERCDLLKLDCEGSEYGILFQASPEILGRVDRIAMEYHGANAGNPDYTGEELERFLSASSFTVRSKPSASIPNHGLIFAWRSTAAPGVKREPR